MNRLVKRAPYSLMRLEAPLALFGKLRRAGAAR